MKKINKFFFLLFAAIAFVSCEDELLELNVDPNNPTDVPAANLITQSEFNLYQRAHSRNINGEWGMLMVQQWAQNEYTQEQRYEGIDGSFFDAAFQDVYTNTLRELQVAKQMISASGLPAGTIANQTAMIDILMADGFMFLTDGFGAIPYSQALNSVDFPNPAYDSQQEVYMGILETLDNATASLDASSSGLDGDLIYGGDVSSWKKFGASLLLKAAMRVVDREPGTTSTYVNKAMSYGVFSDNSDNAMFNFDSDPALSNPLYVDNALNNRDDFCVSELLVQTLEDMGDPRLAEFAALNIFGEYRGMPYGLPDGPAFDLKAECSRPSDRVRSATAPHAIMTYAEVEFFKAEAIERDIISGDAEQAFENGVEASMNQWGIADSGAIDNYLDDNGYDSDNWAQSIGLQKWLALYMNGHEAWAEQRRLDYPNLSAPSDAAISGIPLSFPYPLSEQTNNTSNLTDVTTSPNDLLDPVWWDVN